MQTDFAWTRSPTYFACPMVRISNSIRLRLTACVRRIQAEIRIVGQYFCSASAAPPFRCHITHVRVVRKAFGRCFLVRRTDKLNLFHSTFLLAACTLMLSCCFALCRPCCFLVCAFSKLRAGTVATQLSVIAEDRKTCLWLGLALNSSVVWGLNSAMHASCAAVKKRNARMSSFRDDVVIESSSFLPYLLRVRPVRLTAESFSNYVEPAPVAAQNPFLGNGRSQALVRLSSFLNMLSRQPIWL